MGDKTRELLKAKRRHGWYLALMLVLAVLVTVGVGGLFHQPAVAKTYQVTVLTCTAEAPVGPGYAGYFVHTHNEDCFDENENLVCPLPEIKAHVHDETCYTTTSVQTCGLAESDGHQHSEACYTRVRGDLICGKSTEPVLDEAGNVLEEGHVHTDECFAWTEELTCGMEAGEDAHHHNESCFEYVTNLTCDKPEVILHAHSEDCFQKNEDGSIYEDEDGNTFLICGMTEVTEHVHGPECFTTYELDDEENPIFFTTEETDAASDAESTEGDESGFIFLFPEEEEEKEQPAESANPETETGDTDVTDDGNADPADGNTPDTDETVDTEGTENTELADGVEPNAEGEKQEAASGETAPTAEEPHTVVYTGTRGAERSGMTVLAEIPEGALDENAQLVLADADESAARKQILQLVNENAAEGEEREISSMLLLDIGFVSGGESAVLNGLDPVRVTIRAASIRTMSAPKLFHLSGGTAQEVKDVLFDAEAGTAVFTATSFSPFAIVDLTGDDPAEETAEETVSVLMPAQSFTGETESVIVSVEAPEGAFPAGTTMVVSPVEMDDDTLSNVTGAVESSGEKKVVTAQAVDISFFDADGNLIEPKLPIKVSMKSALVSESENVALVHLAETAAAETAENETPEAPAATTAEVVTDVQVVENPDEDNEIQFESDAFSVYVLVGTETITTNYITADGETYTITVTYGPEAGIPDGAELVVKELPEETDEYIYYFDQTIESLSEGIREEDYVVGLDFARFFDVSIVKDGKKIEPTEPVEVKITYLDPVELTQDTALKVVHFAENGTEIIEIETTETSVTEIAYEQNGFSVIGTVAETNAYGWPTAASGQYVMLLQDGDDYYAVAHDGTLRKVYYLNGTVSFMGQGTTTLSYLDEYLWNYEVVSSTRHTARLSTCGADPINYIDPYFGILPQNSDTPDAVIGSAQRTLYISNGKIYAAYYGVQYTLSAEGGTLHRTTMSAEDASPIYFASLESFTADSSESEQYDFIDINVLIDKWKSEMTQDLVVDKTAEVCDYENRIYQVDLMASSGYHIISPALALEFVVDASRSMFFPENLHRVQVNGSDYTYTTRAGLRNFFTQLDVSQRDTVFYVITDKNNAATNWAVFYHDADKLTVYRNGSNMASGWYYTDASWFYAPDDYSRNYPDKGGDYCYPLYTDYTNFADNKLNDGYIYTADEKVEGRPWSRLDYMQIAVEAASRVLFTVDPEAQIGLVTFNANTYSYGPFTSSQSDDLINAIYNISLDGGTRHADGLDKAISEFNNNFQNVSNCQTAVVLITDGAPNGNTWDQIRTSATNVKAMTNAYGQNTRLFTLGLSLENVGTSKDYLANISTEPHSDFAFSAEQSTEVVNFITKIIEGLTIDANLIGNVTDVIDAGFYPVNPDTGMPLESGTWITEDGQVTTAGAEDAAGQVNNVDGVWKVDWQNCTIDWPTYTDSTKTEVRDHGWNGRVYVKAQEDFLGGNDISTNGTGSQVEATKYVNPRTNETVDISSSDAEKTKAFSTPYVNVDDLLFDENSTEWTVYLGENVDPKQQLQNLLEAVKVYEVVKDDGSLVYTLTAGSVTNLSEDSKSKTGKTFLLSTVIGELSEDDWIKLIGGETIEIEYEAYGHTPGEITLSLTQTVQEGEDDLTPSPHDTSVTGEDVEKYELKISYTPFASSVADYHTGNKGSGSHGDSTDDIDSENVHVINVFAKGLQITKVDLNDQVLPGAKFALYRSARTGETDLLEIDGEQYFKVAELDTSSTGIAVKEQIEQLEEGEQYYLVETEVPAGYIVISPIPVNLNISDIYTPKPGTTTQTTKPDSGIYDWTQNASLVLNAESGVKRTNADNTADLTHGRIVSSSENEIIYYRIINNPGVELPNTGGPGTALFTAIGGIMMATAGAILTLIAYRCRKQRA